MRHGHADISALAEHGTVFTGARYDFVPLSACGRREADDAGAALATGGFRRIVSSPYTRALETAARIARQIDLEVVVDLRLHDWLPVRQGSSQITEGDIAASTRAYEACDGVPSTDDPGWESSERMWTRASTSIADHTQQGTEAVVVVTHEALIRVLVGAVAVPTGSIHPVTWPLVRPTPP